MLAFLRGPVLGTISLILLSLNTILWSLFLFPMALIKLLIPLKFWQRICGTILNRIALNWILFNNAILKITRPIKWEIEGLDGLSTKEWYLVISNHQSWTDIVVLQKVFYGQIPFLKFFLKKDLIKVPVLGLAWWALDFPFMQRYSKEFLAKNPHMQGKDMQATREACQKFSEIPVAVMNYVEGTRFSAEKHRRQESPFKHLLKPKAGGIGFVLNAMQEQLTQILNVTIVYPGCQDLGFWNFLCGRINHVIVKVQTIPIDAGLIGDYANDAAFRADFQLWLNELWHQKDRQIDTILGNLQQRNNRAA